METATKGGGPGATQHNEGSGGEGGGGEGGGGEGGGGEGGGGEGGGGEGGDALPLLHQLPHLGMWTKLRPGAAPPHLH